MTSTPTVSHLIRTTAATQALRIGALWLASFGCAMYGLEQPMLGLLGNVLALVSIVALGRMVKAFRTHEADLGWLGSLRLALHICFYASLVTTLGQYLYFSLLDDGHFFSTISTLIHDPLYTQSALQGVDTDELLERLGKLSTRDIVMQFLFVNLLASAVCGLAGSLLGGLGKVEPKTDDKLQ